MREFCGVFGVFGDDEAATLAYHGLFTLQHRGQESAGIVSTGSGEELAAVKGMGRVAEVFKGRHLEEQLAGAAAIGHVRYSTTGESRPENAQPLVVKTQHGQVALGHNGNLVNRRTLRAELESKGSIFATTTDSEVILHLLARCDVSLPREEVLKRTFRRLKGAFSLLMLWPDAMVAVRDPHGFRPLWLGRRGDAAVVSSETAALDVIDAEPVAEVEPGTFVIIDKDGQRTVRFDDAPVTRHCLFEHVYFARPDSKMFGDVVQQVRQKFGRRLAEEHPVEADIVCAIPDSGNDAALGYANRSGIPLSYAFVRNHYIGRTFIKPSAKERLAATDLKLNVIESAVRGKRVIVVDDSIVRGTTARRRVKRLREAGATEVHFRVSCPPIVSACHYGIDFQSKGELIAASKELEDIRRHLELDSLGYLSLDGMRDCMSKGRDSYCTACWTGDYPVRDGIDEDFEL